MTQELKRSHVLSFDDGLLTVKTQGHGAANGWATLAFHERQVEVDADGFHIVEIPPSELRALRDFLNDIVTQPREPRRKGRPLVEDIDKTLAATRPWAAAGMSRATWFRRQKEGAV